MNDPISVRAQSPDARPAGRSRHGLGVGVGVRGEAGARHHTMSLITAMISAARRRVADALTRAVTGA